MKLSDMIPQNVKRKRSRWAPRELRFAETVRDAIKVRKFTFFTDKSK